MNKILVLNDTQDHCHWGSYGSACSLKLRLMQGGGEVRTFPILTLAEHKDEAVRKRVESMVIWSDTVVINGEGSLHGDRVRAEWLFDRLHFAKDKRKRVEILNSCLLPSGSATRLYRDACSRADKVVVRDNDSLRLMSSLGVVCKLGFDCLPICIRDYWKPSTPISNVDVVFSGGSAYDQGLGALFGKMAEKYAAQGLRCAVLTGASGKPTGGQSEFRRSSKIDEVKADSLDEFLNVMHNASIVITGRYHYAICALCLGKPLALFKATTSKNDLLAREYMKAEAISYFDNDIPGKVAKSVLKENSACFDRMYNLAEMNFQ